MKTVPTPEVDRRTLLKGAAAGVVGAAVLAGTEAEAQDRHAIQDSKITSEMVSFKNGADTINGFLARPKDSAKHGVVIVIPGIFGLDNYVKETTAQLAQAGLVGLAIDFYSRIGGAPKTDDFTVLREVVTKSAPDAQIVSDARAAIAYAKGKPYANSKFGITGFCMGGRITLLTASEAPEIVAASPYYGPVLSGGPTNIAPMDRVGKIKAAVQGHYGGTDMNPKPDDVRAFYAKLKETNPNGEFFIYEGAGHAFHTFDRPASYKPDVAKQAWDRTLAFFKKHLG